MLLKVKKSHHLCGEVKMPPSKAHSFRALILASLAKGTSTITKPKKGTDWEKALTIMRMYGAKITSRGESYQVSGVAGKLQTPPDILNVGNSGTMLFFTAGLAAACPGWTVITGDDSLRTFRTTTRALFMPLKNLGVKIFSTRGNGLLPVVIRGKVNGGKAKMEGKNCQPVFSLLLASALSPKPVDLYVKNPGETAYLELLLLWLKKVGLKVENVGGKYTHFHLPGHPLPQPFQTIIPLDWSAVSYPLLAAMITPYSKIVIKGMDAKDPYGDKLIVPLFQKMGGKIFFRGKNLVASTSRLHGISAEMNLLPDQVPTLAVAACFAQGKTIIFNAETARFKECNRLSAISSELKKMGAKIRETRDGLIINQDGSWKLQGTKVSGFRDHRMVLSLAVAGLGAEGETLISDAEMLEKSFENFVPEMKKIGANFEILPEKK